MDESVQLEEVVTQEAANTTGLVKCDEDTVKKNTRPTKMVFLFNQVIKYMFVLIKAPNVLILENGSFYFKIIHK